MYPIWHTWHNNVWLVLYLCRLCSSSDSIVVCKLVEVFCGLLSQGLQQSADCSILCFPAAGPRISKQFWLQTWSWWWWKNINTMCIVQCSVLLCHQMPAEAAGCAILVRWLSQWVAALQPAGSVLQLARQHIMGRLPQPLPLGRQ